MIKTKLLSLVHSLKAKQAITARDITLLLRQLATLISAGIPIIKCFEIMEKSQTKPTLRVLLYSIKRDMLTGKDLSTCLRPHVSYFDEMTCQFIKIGEHTGKLETLLSMIADYKEKNLAFIKRVKQAFFYPGIISCAALLVTFCMFAFIIPRFAELFREANVQLPLLTIWIFYIARQMQHATGIIFFMIALIIGSLFLPARYTLPIKHAIKRMVLRLPMIYPVLYKITLARFMRTLAISYAAGIPINDALHLNMQAAGHQELTAMIIRLRNRIHSGLQLHQAMESLSSFPELMTQLVKIGEESGMLEPMLNKIADFLEADIEHLITLLNQLLEPLIMLVLGVLIGGLVVGMYLPIFKLGSVL